MNTIENLKLKYENRLNKYQAIENERQLETNEYILLDHIREMFGLFEDIENDGRDFLEREFEILDTGNERLEECLEYDKPLVEEIIEDIKTIIHELAKPSM